MKGEGDLRNALKTVRTRLGLSQGELAQAAGIARQTVGGIEAALFAPSASVALRLARALGCRVEELFWLEDEPPVTVTARCAAPLAGSDPNRPGDRVLLGQIDGAWVAHQLKGESAFRNEMVPADGLIETGIQEEFGLNAWNGGVVRPGLGAGEGGSLPVRILETPEVLAQTVLVAGCSPALSLWTRSAERWHPGLRVAWIHANSTQALEALARGEVHLAGLHLLDPDTGEDNVPFVQRLAQRSGIAGEDETAFALVNLGIWDEGLLVAPGNPLGITGVMDLIRDSPQGKPRLVNRELGSGARILLDWLLRENGVAPQAVRGYLTTVLSHREIGRAVAQGEADAGMGTAAVAQTYGLDFVPLRRVRFDLALRARHLHHEPVRQLLSTLEHRSVRHQLQVLGGYDTARTGERIL